MHPSSIPHPVTGSITRRRAVTGFAAAGIAAAAGAFVPSAAGPAGAATNRIRRRGPASREAREQILLIQLRAGLEDPEFLTAGIGRSGRMLLLGSYSEPLLGTELLATAPIEPWRVPAGITLDEAFHDPRPDQRGRKLALVAGDLGDPVWLDTSIAVMTAARASGRFVVAANAPSRSGELSSPEIWERIRDHCDGFIACTRPCPHETDDPLFSPRTLALADNIIGLTAVCGHFRGRIAAARMAPGLYRADSAIESHDLEENALHDWLARTCFPGEDTAPSVVSVRIPYYTSRNRARRIRRVIRVLKRPKTLLSATYPGELVFEDSEGWIAVNTLTRIS